jgi:hypothetical protein
VAAAHPELSLGVEPELAVLAVGARQQVGGGVVAALGAGLQDEDGALGLVAGQVDVLAGRPEDVVAVVGAGLQLPGRDHQPVAGEACGEGGAALGGVRGLLGGRQVAQFGVVPAGLHDLGELVREGGVEAVLATLDRCLLGGLLGDLLAGLLDGPDSVLRPVVRHLCGLLVVRDRSGASGVRRVSGPYKLRGSERLIDR